MQTIVIYILSRSEGGVMGNTMSNESNASGLWILTAVVAVFAGYIGYRLVAGPIVKVLNWKNFDNG